MNINLNDKKIKKIVYELNPNCMLDIMFENGEISQVNRRYPAAMKTDSFIEDMIGPSRKLAESIKNKKKTMVTPAPIRKIKDGASSFNKVVDAKKLIEMDYDGTIDEIAKRYKPVTTTKTGFELDDEYSKTINDEEVGEDISINEFEQAIDTLSNEKTKEILDSRNKKLKEEKMKECASTVNKVGLGPYNTENDNQPKDTDDGEEEKVKSEIMESISPPKGCILNPNIETPERDKKMYERASKILGNESVRVLMELEKLGFYNLCDKERGEQFSEYLGKAIEKVHADGKRFS